MIVTDVSPLAISVQARVWVDPSKMPGAPFPIREAIIKTFVANKVPLARSPFAGGTSAGGFGGGGDNGDDGDEEAMIMAAMVA